MNQNELKLPHPLQTVPFESFNALQIYVQSLEKRVAFLELHCLFGEWMDRKQAMDFFHISSTKLWQLMKSGEIETSRRTGKTLYLTSSCRDYLAKHSSSKKIVQDRIQEIQAAKKQKQKTSQ